MEGHPLPAGRHEQGRYRLLLICAYHLQVKLGIVLPRSTDLQVELGQPVDKDELRAGDLVFFKTGRTLRHVGVYLEDGRFLHASSKLGVAISHLKESYWKSAYWKAKWL